MNENPAQRKPDQPKCPICGKPVLPEQPSYPFCTQRCRTIDLGCWVDEKYTTSRPVEQTDWDE
jgi:endogenous inhibitor of DNA gyrase (YacG/DUF329 family)